MLLNIQWYIDAQLLPLDSFPSRPVGMVEQPRRRMPYRHYILDLSRGVFARLSGSVFYCDPPTLQLRGRLTLNLSRPGVFGLFRPGGADRPPPPPSPQPLRNFENIKAMTISRLRRWAVRIALWGDGVVWRNYYVIMSEWRPSWSDILDFWIPASNTSKKRSIRRLSN